MRLQGVLVFLLLSFPAWSAESPSTFALSRSPKWLRLLHYARSGSGFKSDAISPSFYVSPEGRTNPEAELVAEVQEIRKSPEMVHTDESPVCKFPARTHWLAEQFSLKVPRSACAQFELFKKSLSADGVSVVFSSYYLNNPSSAFGHTFLRLHHRGEKRDSDRADLLDYGINYAAIQTSNNAVIYALSGALGWFRGSFTKLPFYYKVREYSDFESRDLWFYNLDLPQDQIDELVRHIWELGSTEFDYYFFSTNCSYQLMATLDAVNPDWRILDKLDHTVIPAETIRSLWATPHLVRDIDYRPSNRKRFETGYQALSPSERSVFEQTVKSKSPNVLPADLSLSEKRRVLDLAIDYYDFKYGRDFVEGESAASQEKQKFLLARSALSVESTETKIEVPVDKEPHLGHGSSRVDLLGGYGSSLKAFTELGYRGAFHDLLDSGEGYPDYAEIQILDLGVRAYRSVDNSLRVKLEKAYLVENSSLTPIRAFSYPLSWRLDAGMTRLKEKSCVDCMAGQLVLGGGATVEPIRHFYSYLLFNTQGTWATSFPESKLRLGIGPSLGIRLEPAKHFVLTSEASGWYLVSFQPNKIGSVKTDIRYASSSSQAIGVSHSLTNLETEFGLGYYLYF